MRMLAHSLPKIPNAGWHLSYFMSPEEIAEKIKAFSHTEFNEPQYTDLTSIKNAIMNGKDLFRRSCSEDCVRTTKNDKLPKNVNVLPKQYQYKEKNE